jgi:hypothetical protein
VRRNDFAQSDEAGYPKLYLKTNNQKEKKMNATHPNNIPFQITDWQNIPKTEHKGETGTAFWQTLQFGDLRIRQVEYSANYKADHWCQKGHIIYCIEGEMTTELSDGSLHVMKKGMTYQVSDELSSHRSSTVSGVKLLIIDGAFLQLQKEGI